MAEPATPAAQLTPGEIAATRKAQEITAQFTQRMSNGGLSINVRDLPAWEDRTVLMMVPKPFNLTLDDHRQVRFEAGLNVVPMNAVGISTDAQNKGKPVMGQAIAEHWYVKAHNCEIFNAPKSAEPLGWEGMPDTVTVGREVIPSKNFVVGAHMMSGLSLAAWNALPPEAREDAINDAIQVRQSAVERQASAANTEASKKSSGKTAA